MKLTKAIVFALTLVKSARSDSIIHLREIENDEGMNEKIQEIFANSLAEDKSDGDIERAKKTVEKIIARMPPRDPDEIVAQNWGDDLWEKRFGAPMENMDPRETSRRFGKIWLEEQSQRNDVITTKSGLMYRKMREGKENGKKAVDENTPIKYHYRAMWVNGQEFDASYERKRPQIQRPYMLFPGLREALLIMKEGEKWELFIPSDLAFGERGYGGTLPPNCPIHYFLEIVEIVEEDPENPLDIFYFNQTAPWDGPGDIMEIKEEDYRSPLDFMDDWDEI